MKKENRKALFLVLRYTLLLILGLSLPILYKILAPLTIYPVKFLLGLLYQVYLSNNVFILANVHIKIIDACVAGSAFYLLLLLNLSLSMNLKTRIKSLAFSLALFLAINILRIFIFSILLISQFKYFNFTHLLFWYTLSGIIVFLVWILTIKIYKIREIPLYSDLRFLLKIIKK